MRAETAAQLLYTLSKRTDADKVPWTPTSTEGTFDASFPNATVRLTTEERWDEDEQAPYNAKILRILNEQGDVIESIEPWQVKDFFSKPTAWNVMDSLYEKARDKALGLDEIVTGLLKDLGGAQQLPSLQSELDDEIPF